MRRASILPALLLCCSCAARAEDGVKAHAAPAAKQEAVALFDPARHMRVSEVEPGMKGYGLSVFSGTKLERFDVEVISVLKNQMGARHDIVLIRCRGQGLEHSGAVAGMSGSPIYLTDKDGRERMIGAFALGWEFTKDPIAGVRPIEEMLAVPTAVPEKPAAAAVTAAPARWDALPLVQSLMRPKTAAPLTARDRTPQLKRLSLPLVASGVSAKFLDAMHPLADRDGFTLLQSGGAATAPGNADGHADAKLEPGAAVGIPIVTGDLDLAAIGTVTEVIGNRVFAFGHEFNAEGPVRLPMGVGYVHTVIPNQSMSFKLGSLLRLDGAINSDESVGIAGEIGAVPAMIPIELTVTTPQRAKSHTYQFKVARHPKFTSMGTMMAIGSAVTGQSNLPEEFTVDYALSLEFENGQKLDLLNTTTSLSQATELSRDLMLPMQLALDNPYAETYVRRITGTMTIRPAAELSVIETIQPARTIYKPGETVRLFVTTRAWKGAESVRSADFKLPDDLPDGPYTLTASDASRHVMDETRYSPFRFQTQAIADVFALAHELTSSGTRTLYMRLATQQEGLSVGRRPLPRLPESKRRVLGQPGRPEVLQYTPSFTSETPWDRPIAGAVDIELTIARDPSKATRPQNTGGPAPGAPQGAQPPSRPATPPPAENGH